MNENKKAKTVFDESSTEGRVSDYCSKEFLSGLRILIVDDDRISLIVLARMLQNCLYKVTQCMRPKDALSMLREDRNRFDIVVIDLHMPYMEDGIKLLDDIIGLEMDLPVVMVSSDDKQEVVLKVVLHGACDYLIKPIRMDVLKLMWQHVLRKKHNSALKGIEKSISLEHGTLHLRNSCSADCRVPGITEHTKSLKRKKDGEDEREASIDEPTKKKRLIWTNELHEKFVRAVNYLGPRKAVPMKILKCMQQMNARGVTRENVASHLQKYRLHCRKLDDFPLHDGQHHFSPSGVPRPSILEQSPPLGVSNLQQIASSGQVPVQSLNAARRSVPATLIPNNSTILPLKDQTNLVYSRLPESSCYPLNSCTFSAHDFPLNGTISGEGASLKNISYAGIPPIIEEHEYTEQGSTAQHSKSIPVPFGDFYNTKDDTSPLLIYDPSSLYLKRFDQNEILGGPFMEQSASPLQIEYHSDWQPNI